MSRMKTIEFKRLRKFDDEYYCCCPGMRCEINHSGRWVKAEVAESLLACLKKTASSLENMIDCACDDDCRPKAVLQLEIAQEAIKLAEYEEKKCEKCGGAGWVRGYELDDSDNDTASDTMTRYSCDWCRKCKQAEVE